MATAEKPVLSKYRDRMDKAVAALKEEFGSLRNDDLKKAEKDHVINQDEHKKLEGEVQKITDEAIKRVDEALKAKEQEIMHV